MFPHLPNTVCPTLLTASLFTLLDNSHYPNQMAYFNDHASFYPTSSAREEFNMYQSLGQMSVTEEAKNLTALSPTSYVIQPDEYGQQPYPSHYWPEVGQQTQLYHSGFSSQNFSFNNTVVSEPSAVVPTPSSGKCIFSPNCEYSSSYRLLTVPLDYWGENQSGSSISTPYVVSMGARPP